MVTIPGIERGQRGLSRQVRRRGAQTPQRGSPRLRPSPTQQPTARQTPAPDFSGIGEAVRGLGIKLREQQQQREQTELEVAGIEQLTQLQSEQLQNEDFESAPQEFREQSKQIVRDLVDNATFSETQQRVFRSLARRRVLMAAQVDRNSIQRSQAELEASVENAAATLSDEFARSENRNVREQAVTDLIQTVDGKVEAGIITEEEAEEEVRVRLEGFEIERANVLLAQNRLGEAERFVKTAKNLSEERRRILLGMVERKAKAAAGTEKRDLTTLASAGMLREEDRARVKGLFSEREAEVILQQNDDISGALSGDPATITELVELTQARPPQDATTAEAADFTRRQKNARTILGRLKKLNDNGLLLDMMEQHGSVVNLEDLDPTTATPDQLANRREQVETAQDSFGPAVGTVPFFRPQETAALEQTFEQGSTDDKIAAIRNIAGTDRDTMRRIAQTSFFEDPFLQNVMAVAVGVPSNPSLDRNLRLMFRGREILDEGQLSDLFADKVTDRRAAVTNIAGNTFADDPGAFAQTLSGADAIYASLVAQSGQFDEFDQRTYEKAVRLAAGGFVSQSGEVEGGFADVTSDALDVAPSADPASGIEGVDVPTGNIRILLPAGVGEDEFQEFRSNIDTAFAKEFGNGTPIVQDITGQFRSATSAELRQAFWRLTDRGYVLELPDNTNTSLVPVRVADEDGNVTAQPFVLNIEGVIDRFGALPTGLEDQPTGDTEGIVNPAQGGAR